MSTPNTLHPLRTFTLLTLAILATITLAGDVDRFAIPPEPAGTAVGRFQLVSGQVSIEGDPDSPIPTIFRIDTATGRVWQYRSSTFTVDLGSKRRPITASGWEITSENFLQSYLISSNLEWQVEHKTPSAHKSPTSPTSP